MDLASVLDMLDRTFVDRLDSTLTFETASDSVRVPVVDRRPVFRRTIRSTTGDALLITPGQVVASDGTSSFDVLNVDTDAALTAWKSQPPTTFSPIAAGLNLLTTIIAAVNEIIGRLSGYKGTLGVGLFPSLCWYSGLSHPNIRRAATHGHRGPDLLEGRDSRDGPFHVFRSSRCIMRKMSNGNFGSQGHQRDYNWQRRFCSGYGDPSSWCFRRLESS